MARRAKQRRRQSTIDDAAAAAAAAAADEVEQQLRKQRLERHQAYQQNKNHSDTTATTSTTVVAVVPHSIHRPKTIGKYILDPNRDAYFPKGTTTTTTTTTDLLALSEEDGKKNQTMIYQSSHHPYALIPKRPHNIHAYGIATEICHQSSVRRRICHQWRGHILLSGITTRTGFYLLAQNAGVDVYTTARNHQSFVAYATTTTTNICEESLIWFYNHDGTSLLKRVQQSENTAKIGTTMFHNGPATAMKQNTVGDVVILSNQQQSLTCIKYSRESMEPTVIQTRKNHFINDFAIHPFMVDFTVMAYDRGRWCQNIADRMAIVTSYNHHYHHNNPNSVKSDILSIEIWDDQNAVVCGHRNGQISVGDLRIGVTGWSSPSDQWFGNIASLRPLGRTPLFLAQNFNGVCRLYDVRKNIPLYTMASSNNVCKGMTTDHGNSILINAAHAAHATTTNGGGCALEVWSLGTGEFINSHIVARDQPYELCPTVTQNQANESSLWIAQHQGKIIQIDLKERYLSSC